MKLLPVKEEPKLLCSTLASRNAQHRYLADKLYKLIAERPLPKEAIFKAVEELNQHFKVVVVAPKGEREHCIVIHTLKEGKLYEDPRLSWRPNEQQQEILQMIEANPLPRRVNDSNRRMAKELSRLRGQLWQLYLAASTYPKEIV